MSGIQMAHVVSVTASSALSEYSMTHSAERLIDGLSAPVNTSYVTIVIESVYEGSKFEDTAVSEAVFY